MNEWLALQLSTVSFRTGSATHCLNGTLSRDRSRRLQFSSPCILQPLETTHGFWCGRMASCPLLIPSSLKKGPHTRAARQGWLYLLWRPNPKTAFTVRLTVPGPPPPLRPGSKGAYLLPNGVGHSPHFKALRTRLSFVFQSLNKCGQPNDAPMFELPSIYVFAPPELD
jgi:hypothetical protein